MYKRQSQKSGENSLFKEQLNREGKTEKQSDYLVYYTIGTPDPDLELVTQEINQVLKEKINVTIQYNKIPWNNYGERTVSYTHLDVYKRQVHRSCHLSGEG